MMAKVSDLAPLAQKVNQKTDRINRSISTINEKLAKLNLGVEVWLDSVSDALELSHWSDEGSTVRSRSISYLGYCRIDGKWQLAVKGVTEEHSVDADSIECFDEVNPEYIPLLQASRDLRLAALPAIPKLLDKLKQEGKELLQTIEDAEELADSL